VGVSPVVVKVAVGAVLAVVLVRAFVGPPPARLRPVMVLVSGFAGVVGYPIGALIAAEGHATAGSVTIGAAVCLVSLAAWGARGPGDDGGEPRGEDPDPPVDWEAFDRERERWERAAHR